MQTDLEKKKKLIDRIMNRTHAVAILNNKKMDVADVFFSLAFRSIPELNEICEKIKA